MPQRASINQFIPNKFHLNITMGNYWLAVAAFDADYELVVGMPMTHFEHVPILFETCNRACLYNTG